MRQHIPDYSRECKPLRHFLEEHIKGTNRKSTTLKNITLVWNENSKTAFQHMIQLIKNTIPLEYPNPDAELFLFTDASNDGWGAVLMQGTAYDSTKILSDQAMKPIYFLSGLFTGSSHRWSVIEKEAFAIVESVERLDFLLTRIKPFYIMTDHKNLQYIFAPNNELKTATRHKISRWALALSSFRYEIHHIPGEENVWADLLSRWAKPLINTITIKTIRLHPFEPNSDFVFPTLDEIIFTQQKYINEVEARSDLTTEMHNGKIKILHKGRIWIPEDETLLLQRILIVAHCGTSGHRGVASTTLSVQKFCSTKGLRTKILEFTKQCLLCIQTKGGHSIPRPLGRTIQAQAPNDVIHFDFYHVGLADNGWDSILVVKDGLTHFVELQGCGRKSVDLTVETLLGWFKRYGIAPTWVSDQPTHFRNEVLTTLAKRLRSMHHFTTTYCPWANGVIERANRDITDIFRCILGEFNMPIRHWPLILPIIQYIMNQSPVASLNGLAPIQVFMGREPTPALKEIFNPETKKFITIPITTEKIQQQYDELRQRLQQMHREVNIAADKQHELNQQRHSQHKQANFDIGDYVLWSRIDSPKHHEKLEYIWRGPFRIIDTISDTVFTIQDIITKKNHTVHASRLKFYMDNSLNITAEIKDHITRQGFTYPIEKLTDMRWNTTAKIWEILVTWKGFELAEASWEPVDTLIKDVPELTKIFIQTFPNKTLRQQISRRYKSILQNTANASSKRKKAV